MTDRDHLAQLLDPAMFRPENMNETFEHRRVAALGKADRIIAAGYSRGEKGTDFDD